MSDTAPDQPVRFDTKIVVLLAEGLEAWQELNVTSFVVSGIATSEPDLVGEPYVDADGVAYRPMLRQPVVVMTAPSELLASARAKAVERGFAVAIYTRDLFATGHDAANRAAVAVVASADLDLVGLALRGPKNAVDKAIKGARLHA